MFANIPRRKFSLIFKLTLGLSASVILLLASIGFSYRVSDQLYQSYQLVEHTDLVIAQLDLLTLKINDCESSVKAYVMSNRSLFLRNYESSRQATRQYVQSLEKLTVESPEHQQRIERLRRLVRERFQLLEKAIAIQKGQTTDEKGLLNRAIRAKQLRTAIQATVDELKQELECSLEQRKAESLVLLRNNQLANRASVGLGCVLAVLLGIIVLKDVRERESTEQQLRVLNTQKSQFFSIISHDLRGPTRNTCMLLEMIDDPSYRLSPQESQRMTQLALDSARQTHKLVEDLLVWGRVQMDQVGVVATRFRPYEVVENVCRALQSSALLKNITLENRISRSLWIQADANMVETVIRNLVSNAIKFTPEAGRVSIVAQQAGQFVELVVEDTGVGMSDEAIQKIFSVHTKHTTKGTAGELGTGLGLAVCREFVERNGGTIGVDSQPGLGSRFNVRLPSAELQEQE